MSNIKSISASKVMSLIAGIFLLIVAIIESVEQFENGGLGLHYGVALFAVAHILNIVVDLHESHQLIKEAVE